jgi:hypothetical protein
MIEPNGAGMAHGRRHQMAHGGEILRRQRLRIERDQAPILPVRIERIGRRADRHVGEQRVLLHPGVGAARIDADREIRIKTDRHAQAPRRRLAGA